MFLLSTIPRLQSIQQSIRPAVGRFIIKTANTTNAKKSTYATGFTTMASATTFYDFAPLKPDGQQLPMSDLKGKVVLMVNVASKCGFTPQYEGLEQLHERYSDQGLVILGFPCNQFGGQEPGTDEEIKTFCQTNYGVKFQLMKKVEVNGDKADPLWEFVKKERPGLAGMKRVKWNYEKFLIGRDGKVVDRWASLTKPESLAGVIEKELAKPAPASL
ncbi:glutathione peroxidase [Pyronema omphalodes]|nr:glutathione peroxidase [Pyronema omphalodes]